MFGEIILCSNNKVHLFQSIALKRDFVLRCVEQLQLSVCSSQYRPSQKEDKSEFRIQLAILLSEYLYRRMLSKTKGE